MEAAKEIGEATMATEYWCYLLDIDRIIAGFVIECGDDASALRVAARAVEALPCTAAEVWDRHRKISTISREAPQLERRTGFRDVGTRVGRQGPAFPPWR
jgi:hypothetical protein